MALQTMRITTTLTGCWLEAQHLVHQQDQELIIPQETQLVRTRVFVAIKHVVYVIGLVMTKPIATTSFSSFSLYTTLPCILFLFLSLDVQELGSKAV